MQNKWLLFWCSAAHFWMDLSCAVLLLHRFSVEADFQQLLLFYNFCAFALQMPFGLLADRLCRDGLLAAGGCALTALAFLLPGLAAVLAAGIGNALFHLGGGRYMLNDSQSSAAPLGIFVAPGAIGLFLGIRWGAGAAQIWLAPAVLACFAAVFLFRFRTIGTGMASPVQLDGRSLSRLLPLFLVVVLRSYMGMNQAFAWKGSGLWWLWLLLALALGKAAGGFLLDFVGQARAAAFSLLPAAALYLLCRLPLPGTLAVFLFNMTMPVTLFAAAQLTPGAKGFAFGLLTFGLFLGFLPSYFAWPSLLTQPWSYALAAAASFVLLCWPMRQRRTLQPDEAIL